jgi:acyl-coenzyme A synthetase/AMP-(fatty) acid ligase
MLRARDLSFRARHAGARLLVADPGCRAEVDAMEHAIETVYVDEAALGDEDDETCDTAADEPAFILYTSGTTKEPKGVTHTHAYTWAKRFQAERWLDAKPDDLVWCTAGSGWAKSIWNVLLGPWSCGSALVLHAGGFEPEQRFDLIGRLGVTVLCQAPTEYRLMAKLAGLERFDLTSLRHAVSAGEPLNPEVIKVFRDAFGLTIHDGYGQTENTLLVGNFPGMEIRPGSMGLPSPGHEIGVIGEDGEELPPGEEGDIALRGHPPSLFAGYYDAPEETAAVFRGEWYVTGDRAELDEDGYLWFTGRADDVINSAAYRIGPFEVESALLEHEAVAESAVIGKPDAERGQIVKAFVVLRPGHEGDDALVRTLQEHCKRVTAPYKYPREIEFVAELPKTRSGKIRRVELRKLEAERTST